MTETPSIAGTRGRIPQAAVKSLLAIATVVLFAAGCARDDPARVEGAETTVSESTGAGEVITTSTVHAKDDGHDEGASHADDVEAAHDEPDVPIDEPAATTLPEGIDLVVQVDMLEFGYELDTPTIPVGSTVRFDFVNEGAIEHEAMFGDSHQQEEFAATEGDHGRHGDGEVEDGHHGEVSAITLASGETGSLVVTFDEPGEMLIGCHLPGHWDAGMVAAVVIV